MNNSKIGYAFNKSTGEFIGAETVYFETRIGDYPHADNVVFIAPPKLREHEKAYWGGKNWRVELDEGYIEDGEIIREMTVVEKIRAGLDKLPEDMKIVNGELVSKTLDDLYAEGKLTIEEYNIKIDVMRQERYQTETDKMGLMYLRGECTLEEWKSAMDKIREELPKK